MASPCSSRTDATRQGGVKRASARVVSRPAFPQEDLVVGADHDAFGTGITSGGECERAEHDLAKVRGVVGGCPVETAGQAVDGGEARQSLADNEHLAGDGINDQRLCLHGAERIGHPQRLATAEAARYRLWFRDAVDDNFLPPSSVVADVGEVEIVEVGIGSGSDRHVFPITGRQVRQ